MNSENDIGPNKGQFGAARHPVAKKYPGRTSRNRLYAIGGIGALVIAGLFFYDAWLNNGALVSSGPLTSNHAAFGTDCQSCHTPGEGVPDANCQSCHEKFGDELGIHTFEAHYLYRSGDLSRVTPSANEVSCSTCHNEHQGVDHPISLVADAQCSQCHTDITHFNGGHPEFDIIAEERIDDANLFFPHSLHVAELQRREDLVDIEKACLYCHEADDDGKGFEPIDFESDCDACHLSSSTATPFLAVREGNSPGVETIQSIASGQGAGTRWAFFANAEEYQQRGNSVRKRPVYHADPWIMENLRRIRKQLYPGDNLADLLLTSGDVETQDVDILYEEALATLQQYVDDLRNQPGRTIQTEIAQAEALLNTVERRLDNQYEGRDDSQFIISEASLNPALSESEVQSYLSLADQLTQPCQECHQVSQATIQRVQTDQRTLIRSEFDHAAHVIQARCMDCHNQIPIEQFVALDSIPPPEVDRAELFNIPSVASCQQCHDTDKASDTCITCHAFHPDKSQRSNLLLYLD